MCDRRRGAGLALATFLLAAGVAGCGGQEPAAPDLAVRIRDEGVAYSEFEAYLAENSVDPDYGWGSDVLSALFDQFLDEELLRRLATERNAANAEDSRRKAVEQLLAEAIAEGVSDQQVASHYRRHRASFERPERARVRQMLLTEQASVDRVLAELEGGASFEELAERLSQVPAGAIGDEALAREELPPSFADAIFALEPGEVSAPVATDYGYHLFQLVELLPAGAPPLEAVASEIRESLRRELSERRLSELVHEARRRYNVKVFERNLPFNYQGIYSDGLPPSSG